MPPHTGFILNLGNSSAICIWSRNLIHEYGGRSQAEELLKRLSSGAPETFNILVFLESVHRMLTVREVAQVLQESQFRIYRMARRRQIPSLVIGETRYFDLSVLALWISK